MNKNALGMSLLVLLVFIVGFGLGRMTQGGQADFLQNGIPVQESNTVQDDTSVEAEGSVQGGTTVDTSSLTEGQRQLIEALGIDADTITITPEMVACAEAKLGAARIEEIQNGATPSFTEGASLVACYR